MSNQLIIQSHKGPYSVEFDEHALERIQERFPEKVHYVVDAKVANLYRQELADVLDSSSVLLIEAQEGNKSLEKCPDYIKHLVGCGVRRGHALVGIGGGIIQDVVCFLAAILLRGLNWHFYPTTLLAQADSCIGSKSSINVYEFKNIVGTFTPPKKVFISTRVLATLAETDIRSGIGEMLKVHAIDGPGSFDRIAKDYESILTNARVMRDYILRSLEIKKRIIEQDEFDQGIRNVMNYGHSFGHAIESATRFAVPHGIAVTIGMDMANYAAMRLGRMDQAHFERMHPPLATNYREFENVIVPMDLFMAALSKDKKNTDSKLGLILPDGRGIPQRTECQNDSTFLQICADYFRCVR